MFSAIADPKFIELLAVTHKAADPPLRRRLTDYSMVYGHRRQEQ